MGSLPVLDLPRGYRSYRARSVLVTSADSNFRHRLAEILAGLRWTVREAEGGAQAWAEAEAAAPEALILDSWLPDLEMAEFLKDFRGTFPQVDLVTAAGSLAQEGPRGPYRQELLYALRRSQDTDTAAWNTAPNLEEFPPPSHGGRLNCLQADRRSSARNTSPVAKEIEALKSKASSETAALPHFQVGAPSHRAPLLPSTPASLPAGLDASEGCAGRAHTADAPHVRLRTTSISGYAATNSELTDHLPELIGMAPCMIEVSRRVRRVATRSTAVLIEGPTGSGKELVAEAIHRLSNRSRKPLVTINCAAIPESLLEAELFGHTRGAFTGAVQGRVGRIEAADGGTLFLDEIGEMPLPLQSKLLRFVECGELQRVGDNETQKVDVRILAATHRPLIKDTQEGTFRADLYYRLAVFLIHTPALREHVEDLPLLIDHFIQRLGRETPVKRVGPDALTKLESHDWPGNVRELEHVLERATILAGDESVLTAGDIDFGLRAH